MPILLGGLFKLTGNQSPATAFAGIKNKPDYEGLEMQRFVARHGIDDFAFNPHFPINTLQLMRGAVAAQELGCSGLRRCVLRRDVDARARHGAAGDRRRIAERGGPARRNAVRAVTDAREIKQRLIDKTQAAFERGRVRHPVFLVGNEL